MHKAAFEYHRPETLDEAIGLLSSTEGARAIAGGHSLLPVMKLRLAAPDVLVDIARIPGLSGIESDGTHVTIGALTTHAEVAASDVLASDCPVLAEAAATIGDPQVRNRGTIGGSVSHADPAADYPTVLTALGAEIVAKGPDGERTIGAADFFVDLFTTALNTAELVTSVRVPVMAADTRGAYVKHRHPASSYAVVGSCAIVSMGNGTISDARIVVGGASVKPIPVPAAASALSGQAPSDEAFAAAAGHVAAAVTNPIGDTYASGEYRTHLCGVLTKRALAIATAAV